MPTTSDLLFSRNHNTTVNPLLAYSFRRGTPGVGPVPCFLVILLYLNSLKDRQLSKTESWGQSWQCPSWKRVDCIMVTHTLYSSYKGVPPSHPRAQHTNSWATTNLQNLIQVQATYLPKYFVSVTCLHVLIINNSHLILLMVFVVHFSVVLLEWFVFHVIKYQTTQQSYTCGITTIKSVKDSKLVSW